MNSAPYGWSSTDLPEFEPIYNCYHCARVITKFDEHTWVHLNDGTLACWPGDNNVHPDSFADPLELPAFPDVVVLPPIVAATTEKLTTWWEQLGYLLVTDLPLYDLSSAVGAELRKRNVPGDWWEGFNK